MRLRFPFSRSIVILGLASLATATIGWNLALRWSTLVIRVPHDVCWSDRMPNKMAVSARRFGEPHAAGNVNNEFSSGTEFEFWSLTDGRRLAGIPTESTWHQAGFRKWDLSYDGLYVAEVVEKYQQVDPDVTPAKIRVWRVADQQLHQEIPCEGPAGALHIQFSENDHRLVVQREVSSQGQLSPGRVWDVATGRETCQFETTREALQVSFSPQGRFLLADTNVIWDAATGEQLTLGEPREHSFVQFSADERRLLLHYHDGKNNVAEVWQTSPLQKISQLSPGPHGLPYLSHYCVLTNAGKVLAQGTWSGSPQQPLLQWDAVTGVLEQQPALPGSAAYCRRSDDQFALIQSLSSLPAPLNGLRDIQIFNRSPFNKIRMTLLDLKQQRVAWHKDVPTTEFGTLNATQDWQYVVSYDRQHSRNLTCFDTQAHGPWGWATLCSLIPALLMMGISRCRATQSNTAELGAV